MSIKRKHSIIPFSTTAKNDILSRNRTRPPPPSAFTWHHMRREKNPIEINMKPSKHTLTWIEWKKRWGRQGLSKSDEEKMGLCSTILGRVLFTALNAGAGCRRRKVKVTDESQWGEAGGEEKLKCQQRSGWGKTNEQLCTMNEPSIEKEKVSLLCEYLRTHFSVSRRTLMHSSVPERLMVEWLFVLKNPLTIWLAEH